MKINIFWGTLILIFAISFLASCSGDSDLNGGGNGNGDDDPIIVDVRPSVIYAFSEDVGEIIRLKYHYTYAGNRVNKIKMYEENADGLWEQDGVAIYSYLNDWVTINYYDDSGTEQPYYIRVKATDGRMLEYETIYPNDESLKLVYTYDNFSDDLTKIEWIENNEIKHQWEYSYSGNQVSECIESNMGNGTPSPNYKSEFVYVDYRLSEIINYQWWLVDNELTWVKFSKDDYFYFNENVTEINNYYWDLDASEWVSGKQNEYFTYAFNSDGLLEKYEEIMFNHDYKMDMQIEYEPGYGNLESFSDPEKNIRKYPINFQVFYY